MTQADFSDIDPGQTSGVQLADILGDWADALLSSHAGINRPTYAVPGMCWIKTGVTNNQLMYFTGSTDLPLFEISPTGVITGNADKVDDLHGAQLLRSDVDDTATGVIDFANGMRIGRNGGGDSWVRFYDDDADVWRSLWWSSGDSDWRINDASGGAGALWHAGNHGPGSGLNADLLDGLHGSSYLRRDAATSDMIGLLRLMRDHEEQLLVGINTGQERDPFIAIYNGLTQRRGYIQAKGDRFRINRDGGAEVDLFGSGDVRVNGHRVHHDGNRGEYISPETTLVAGSTVTFPHGLSTHPRQIDLLLVCKTAHHGYGVGAEVPISSGEIFSNWGAQAQTPNGSQIRVVIGANGLVVLNASTGVRGTISGSALSNWKLKVRAEL